MIIISVSAAILSVLLWLPSRRRLGARLAVQAAAAEPAPSSHRLRTMGWVLGLTLAVAMTGVVLGAAAAVVAVAAAMIASTTLHGAAAWLRARRATATRDDIAQACQSLARLVAAGEVPTAALSVAAADFPVLREAAAVQHLGGDPVTVWRTQAHLPGHDGLVTLARAWQVSRATGARMLTPLVDAAAAVRADHRVAQVVAAELAAPRATGRLLALLPLFGIVLGFVIGGNPLWFLTSHAVGRWCLVGGVGLACGGVVWVERLADQANPVRRRDGTTDGIRRG